MPVKIVNKSLLQTVGKWFLESPDQSLNLFWSLSIRPKASVQKTIKLHFQLISTVNLEVFRNIYFIGMWGKWKLSLSINNICFIKAKSDCCQNWMLMLRKQFCWKKRSTICIDTDDNLVPGCVCRELKWDPGELLGGSWRMHQTVSYYPCPYNPKTLHLEDALLHLCTLVGQFVGASSVQLCRPRKLALGSAGGGGGRMHLRGSRGPKPRCYPPSAAQGQVFPICRVGK